MRASELYPFGFSRKSYANVTGKAHDPFTLGNSDRQKYVGIDSCIDPSVKRVLDVWANAVTTYTIGISHSALTDPTRSVAKT